eukprot:6453442-Prymnesium_polylepis.2
MAALVLAQVGGMVHSPRAREAQTVVRSRVGRPKHQFPLAPVPLQSHHSVSRLPVLVKAAARPPPRRPSPKTRLPTSRRLARRGSELARRV